MIILVFIFLGSLSATFFSELEESRLHESEIRELLMKFSKPAQKMGTLQQRLRNTERELLDLENEMATETMEWEKTRRLLEESLEEELRHNSSTGPFASLWSAWNPPDDSINTIMDNQRALEEDYKHRITLLDRRHNTTYQRKVRLERKLEESKKASEMVKHLEKDLDECIQEQLQLSQIHAESNDDVSATQDSVQVGLDESSLQTRIERLVSSSHREEDPEKSRQDTSASLLFEEHLEGLKREASRIHRANASSDEILFLHLVDALERLETGIQSIEKAYAEDIKFLQRLLWHHSKVIAEHEMDPRLQDASLQVMEEVLGRIDEKRMELDGLTAAMYRRQAELIEQISQVRSKML